MMIVAAGTRMTTEEMLALPDNGMRRWLIDGRLREEPMAVPNRFHSRIMVRVSYLLESWLVKQPQPRGSVLGGEAGVRLRRNPDSTVGIDVVYVSSEVAARQDDEPSLIDGVPVLAVEILSPSDVLENTEEKLDRYLEVGVPVVWVINPRRRTLVIYRPGAEPEMVTASQEVSGEPELPGFRVPLAEFFVL
jgi:Uma2 family endonuclease